VLDAFESHRAGTAHHPDDPVAFGKQEFGQIGAILASDAGNQCCRHVHSVCSNFNDWIVIAPRRASRMPGSPPVIPGPAASQDESARYPEDDQQDAERESRNTADAHVKPKHFYLKIQD